MRQVLRKERTLPFLRTNAENAESHPIELRTRGEVERASVFVAPGEVVCVLRRADRAEVLAFGREQLDPARTAHVDIAARKSDVATT